MDFKICVSICYFSLFGIFSCLAAESSSFVPVDLRTEYLQNPLTLETFNPRFSWKLRARSDAAHNLTQSAYQILVSSVQPADNGALSVDLWDSGVVKSDDTVHIRYGGKPLKSRQLAVWKVKVWDQNGVMAESETSGHFGIGLLHKSDWKAKWIHAPAGMNKNLAQTLQNEDQTVISKLQGLLPPLYFRKSFKLEQTHGARLFATSKGVYEIYINGKRLQMTHLKPGYTDYHKSFRYQSFENVENYLHKGDNVIGVLVATGWYAGYMGYNNTQAYFGKDIGALVQLDIGDHTIVQSDSTWKVSTGPIVYSDMFMGETYYVDKEINGWNEVTFSDAQWGHVMVENRNEHITLIGDVSEPVVTSMILTPKSMHESKPGVFIFDFGQNFAGVCSLKVHAGQGPARIQLRHGEALEKPYMSGSLYTDNLGAARATDTLVIKHNVTKEFTYTPSFTFHGFRFVELTGYGTRPKLSDIVANVVHSGFSVNSHIETSNEHVNRLLKNIQWSLRSNFLSVPTDCPQRAERLGWTADAQVFASTAVYNADLAAFYTKWLVDMRESQFPDGGIPDTVPIYERTFGSPGWQDAMVVVPWVVYHTYGDEQVIKDNYNAMAKFVNHITALNPDYIWKNGVNHNLGDWFELNATTDHLVSSTAYYAQDVLLLSKMAAAIDKTEDAKKYSALFHNISNSFNTHYVKSDGTIKEDTQASYAFALTFSLLPEKLRPLAAKKLEDNVKQHRTHLTTGFLGVSLLNPALTEHGYNDVAYQLLLQESYPSWLYPVVHGNATTTWERWNGWTEENGFFNGANSFNHYSFGSVGVWLYSEMAGITSDGAGYKNILIKPKPGPGITSVNATYDSIRGPINSSWKVKGDTIEYTVTIPANTKATIVLPNEEKKHEVGSGTWTFKAKKNF